MTSSTVQRFALGALVVVLGCGSSDPSSRTAQGESLVSADASVEDPGSGDAGTSGTTDASTDEVVGCDVPPAVEVSAADLVDRAESLHGEVVAVVGQVTAGPTQCTSIPCPMDNQCCNQCEATMAIAGVQLTSSSCFNAGCSGNECSLTCRPDTNAAAPNTVVGVFSAGPPMTLKVISVQ